MKRYNEYESVEELYEAYNIKPLSKFLTEADNKKSAGYEKEKKKCIPMANMYIWMFSINDIVYYGRTWEELKEFLYRITQYVPENKYVFISD